MMQKYHLIDEAYVTFGLDGQEYAVPQNKVAAILGTEGMMDSEHTEPCVRGAVLVGNHKVAVLDPRCLFGFEARTEKKGASVMVVSFGRESVQIGLMVDSIGAAVPVIVGFSEKDQVSETDPRDKYILGQVQVQGRTLLLLNSDKCGQYLRPYSLV